MKAVMKIEKRRKKKKQKKMPISDRSTADLEMFFISISLRKINKKSTAFGF